MGGVIAPIDVDNMLIHPYSIDSDSVLDVQSDSLSYYFLLIIFQHPGGEEVLLEQAGEHLDFFFVYLSFFWCSSPINFTLILHFFIYCYKQSQQKHGRLPSVPDVCDG